VAGVPFAPLGVLCPFGGPLPLWGSFAPFGGPLPLWGSWGPYPYIFLFYVINIKRKRDGGPLPLWGSPVQCRAARPVQCSIKARRPIWKQPVRASQPWLGPRRPTAQVQSGGAKYSSSNYAGVARTLNCKYQKFMTYPLVYNILKAYNYAFFFLNKIRVS